MSEFSSKNRPAVAAQSSGAGTLPEPRNHWRGSRARRMLIWFFSLVALATLLSPAAAGPEPANRPMSLDHGEALGDLAAGPEQWTSPEGLGSTLQVMVLLAVVSLAPAVLLMTTSFVRIVVVLGLLRQALGTQQLPPSQVITSLALFLSLLIMSPVWKQVYHEAILPYSQKQVSAQEAWTAGVRPVRRFMIAQIEATHNTDDIYLFLDHAADDASTSADDNQEVAYDDIPLSVLLPAFMLSELKTAFLIGFQIYLPFLVIDMVVASVMVSMGMLMLPPALVSLPLKLLLFVLLDGWTLVVGMLLSSFQAFT